MLDIKTQNEKPLDLICLGRLCIDLNPNQINSSIEKTTSFTKYVGGSPANISIGASRLGLKTGFIGKISDDQMGQFIISYLTENNINTDGVTKDDTGAVTGLTFTEIESPEQSSILMYRDNVADLKLKIEDISEDYINKTKILLISGTALATSPSREAVFYAVECAKKNNVKIIFDLDYRPYTWTSEQDTSIYYSLVAEKSDVIIGSKREFNVMEKLINKDKGEKELAERWFDYCAEIVIIKRGKEGSIAFTKEGDYCKQEVLKTKVMKSFGGGDAFASAFIFGLINKWELSKTMKYSSASASIVISSHSCSEAMPTHREINEFVKNTEK